MNLRPETRRALLRVRNDRANEGIEMTPAEIEQQVGRGFNRLRKALRARGEEAPEDAEGMAKILVTMDRDKLTELFADALKVNLDKPGGKDDAIE